MSRLETEAPKLMAEPSGTGRGVTTGVVVADISSTLEGRQRESRGNGILDSDISLPRVDIYQAV